MKLFIAAFAAAAVASPGFAQDAHANHSDHAHHATAATARLTLDTPVEAIVADPAGKAALEANLPGITSHESYEMFKGMGLKQLAGFAPDRLTPEVLAKVETELAKIK